MVLYLKIYSCFESLICLQVKISAPSSLERNHKANQKLIKKI